MNSSNYTLLLELIQEAFTTRVLDQFGTTMDEAYLLDNWTTDEGFLVNGITQDGLIYEDNVQKQTLYRWELLHHSTLKKVLTHLQEEAFA